MSFVDANVSFDINEVRRFLHALFVPGTCFEIRIREAKIERGYIIKNEYNTTLNGFFDDVEKATQAIRNLKGVHPFVTVNPVSADLMAMPNANKIGRAIKGDATSDQHIEFFRQGFLDIDPVKKLKNASATDEERANALTVRTQILKDFPEIAKASHIGGSGNGWWINPQYGKLPNDLETTQLNQRFQVVIGRIYSGGKAHIDSATFNAARIMSIPGTKKCKGTDTLKNPWRLCTFDSPKDFIPEIFNLRGWLAEHDKPALVDPGAKNQPMPSMGNSGTSHNSSAGRKLDPRFDSDEIARKAQLYVSKIEGAVSGQGGHNKTFDVACSLIKGFDLSIANATPIMDLYNNRCQPPWTPGELQHKLESAHEKADKEPRGYLLNAPMKERPNTKGATHEAVKGQPNASGEQRPPMREDGAPFPIVDVQEIDNIAKELVASNHIENLYRHDEFFRKLAILEIQDNVEYQVIRSNLRNIKNYRQKEFDRIFTPHRYAISLLIPKRVANQSRSDEEFTDLGNAKRLVRLYGDKIRYCKSYGDWMIYDGGKWSIDSRWQIESYSQRIPQSIIDDIPDDIDSEIAESYYKWSRDSQKKERMTAMIHSARSMVSITPADLDPDPWLLNVRNGTIDLKTGDFYPHKAEDLVTRIANVSYDADAKAPTWERFITEIMDDDVSVADYLRRAVGYSITGDIREHALFFLQGSGRNGKTVMLNTLFKILGDYANQIDSDLLLDQKNKQHPTGLTEFEGRRLVSADESDDGHRLAEAQIKKLTGGNYIQARRMNQNFYSFAPTHHLFYAANYRPDIRGMDPAIWQRVKLIEFKVCFDGVSPKSKKPDYDLEKKLALEAPGILNWMLRGCREWQEHGLKEPESITRAVADYRREMDILGWYLDEQINCHLEEVGDKEPHEFPNEYRVVWDTLYKNYCAWCQGMNSKPLGPRRFTSQLNEKGYKTYKANSVTYKIGLTLKKLDNSYLPR